MTPATSAKAPGSDHEPRARGHPKSRSARADSTSSAHVEHDAEHKNTTNQAWFPLPTQFPSAPQWWSKRSAPPALAAVRGAGGRHTRHVGSTARTATSPAAEGGAVNRRGSARVRARTGGGFDVGHVVAAVPPGSRLRSDEARVVPRDGVPAHSPGKRRGLRRRRGARAILARRSLRQKRVERLHDGVVRRGRRDDSRVEAVHQRHGDQRRAEERRARGARRGRRVRSRQRRRESERREDHEPRRTPTGAPCRSHQTAYASLAVSREPTRPQGGTSRGSPWGTGAAVSRLRARARRPDETSAPELETPSAARRMGCLASSSTPRGIPVRAQPNARARRRETRGSRGFPMRSRPSCGPRTRWFRQRGH